jgi:two-component system heavy metal sensor histidine kinase CusS
MRALSVRIRLTIWYSLILALSLGVFGSAAYFAMSHSIRSAVDAGLRRRVEGVRGIISRTAPEGLAALKDELSEYDEGQGKGSRLRVADSSGAVIYGSPGTESSVDARPPSREESNPFYVEIHGEQFRVLNTRTEANGSTYEIEVATYTEDFDLAIDRFRRLLYLGVPIFLALTALGGYWMSRRALAPVDEIIEAARRIGVTSLSSRLAVPQTRDELQRLASTLNQMLERLEASFHRITQFTADASHELRTPISLMRTNAEIMLRKPRTEAEYRAALSQILEETQKVSLLIEQLLDLARADSGSAAFPLVRTKLNEAMENAYQKARVLADAKQLNISEHLPTEPVWIQGDPSALERLFLIFLDNAVKYTAPGGQIEMHLTARDGVAGAEVLDTGIGISEADLPHIFERFYQADRSRSRDNRGSGSGLGLAIGRWIAEIHGGDIAVESEISKGTSFRIRFPISR